MLDLRYGPDEDPSTASNQTSIRFASRLQGNLGGSLNSVWGSGIPGDAEDVDVSHTPDNPEGDVVPEDEDNKIH